MKKCDSISRPLILSLSLATFGFPVLGCSSDSDGDDVIADDDDTEDPGDGGVGDDSDDDTDDSDDDTDDADDSGDDADDDDTSDGLFLIDCSGERSDVEATVVDAHVAEDATWSGVVYLADALQVESGIELSIEAGTHVVAAAGASLTVAEDAVLRAEGEEGEEVHFCSERDDGDSARWGGIIVQTGAASDSTLEHTVIADAGTEETPALTLRDEVLIQSVRIVRAAGDGIHAESASFAEGSADLSITECGGTAVVLGTQDALSRMPSVGEFSGNGDDRIRIEFTEISENTTVPGVEAQYLQVHDMSVHNGAELTFEAGAEYVIQALRHFEVGWNDEPASIFCEGTEDEPVVFLGEGGEPGGFEGLLIQDTVTTDSFLSYVEIRYGGDADWAPLRVRSPIRLEHVSIIDSVKAAAIEGQGLAEGSTDLTITGCQEHPLEVSVNGLVTLPEGGDYSGNEEDWILVEGGDYLADATVKNLGVPYRVMSTIETQDDSSFLIEPGVHFIMDAGTQIVFGAGDALATVDAQGTSDEMIRFTGVEETAGFWQGIVVGGNVTSDSRLEFIELAHAGSSAQAALELRSAISVTDSLFRDCEGSAIMAPASALTTYETENSFEDIGGTVVLPL